MKTFDEAVTEVLTVPADPVSCGPQQAGSDRIAEKQMGFKDEVMGNPTVQFALSTIIVSTLQDTNEIPLEGRSQTEIVQDTYAVFLGSFMSVLMWGVAIGREMELTELPELKEL